MTTPTATGWASVTAGSDHTCATRAGGTLWCWGDNRRGELGIGNDTEQFRFEFRPRPVTIPARRGWVSVTAGGHTCATRTGGTLWCWGANGGGELGIGNDTGQDRPRQVTTPTPTGWASVTAGSAHTCATRAGGTLWCWGFNGSGSPGIGNYTDQDRPRQVTTPAPGGWAGVTASYAYTCATRAGGTLWCWGANYVGQLGIGNHVGQDLPRQVTSCTQPPTQLPARPQ